MNKDLEFAPETNEEPVTPELSIENEEIEEIVLADENPAQEEAFEAPALEISEPVSEPTVESEPEPAPQPAPERPYVNVPPMGNPAPDYNVYYKKREFKGAESVFAWICMLIGYLFCRAFPPIEKPLGMLIAVVIAIIGTTAILAKKGAKFNFYSIFAAFTSLAFATSFIFMDSGIISLIALFSTAYAYFYFVYSATGNRAEKGITNVIPFDILRAAFVFPFVSFFKLFPAMFARNNNSMKSVFKVLLGFLLALIPTGIVIAFLSYDAEFSELFNKILDFIDDFNIFSHIGSIILGSFVAMYIFGLYATATDEERPGAITSEKCEKVHQHVRFVPALTVAAALLPVLGVYVIFFISQWKYYVSAFTGVLPEGVLSYAEYARDGFFELCAVSVVNFILIILVAIFQRREKNGDRVFLRLANITVSVMTLVLIGTAMAKMWLYINQYGLTEKRVLSSWFMIVLAIVYLAIILGQLIPKIKLVAASLFIITVMSGLLCFANHPAVIANYNVDLYINGKTEKIDVETLYYLGDSAVPALVDLADFWENDELNEKQENDKNLHYERLIRALKRSKERLDDEKNISAFSLPSYEAEKTLNKFFKNRD